MGEFIRSAAQPAQTKCHTSDSALHGAGPVEKSAAKDRPHDHIREFPAY